MLMLNSINMMKAVQIVFDDDLLRQVDREARQAKSNRSALVRKALREHLQRRRIRELEARHRAGYERHPATEFDVWDRVSVWPEE
jgi:metal-responsive CopG/Arc/MetJ family transcriptional regulator